MSTRQDRFRHVSRWGLLAVALLLGFGLIATTLLGYSEAHGLQDPLARGQADSFLRGLHERIRPELGPPSPQTMEDLLATHQEGGLRFVALLDRDDGVLVSAGQALVAPAAPLPELDRLELDGGRVRLLAAPPMPPPPPPWGAPPSTATPRWPPPPPPNAAGHAPAPPPVPRVLIEFEPLLARQLIARAQLDVGVGIAVALLLMLAAAVFWKMSLRAARAEADLVRQRHLASLGEMSAVLAHEIRNPLTAAKGHAQLLGEQLEATEDHARSARAVRQVVDHLARLEQLTSQLLDFARIGEIARAEISPAALLGDAASALAPERVQLDVELAPEAWPLDGPRMTQVLSNLLRNAAQASTEDELIEASICEQDGELLFVVRDHGEGIEPAELERIFQPFHTTRVRGTGLGLAFARRIVDLHGGRIEAANHPDGGAEFRVALPPA